MPDLSISDQIILLALGENGVLHRPSDRQLDYAIAGTTLIDLAFQDRIDTDLQRLFVIDQSPTGDPLLDTVLKNISAGPPDQPTSYWISEIAGYAPGLRQQLINDLLARNLIRKERGRRLLVFKSERYPPVDPMTTRNLHRRLIDVLLSSEIPAPEEVALVSLASACSLLELLLPSDSLKRIEPRIEQLAKMDLISRNVNRTLAEIQAAYVVAAPWL